MSFEAELREVVSGAMAARDAARQDRRRFLEIWGATREVLLQRFATVATHLSAAGVKAEAGRYNGTEVRLTTPLRTLKVLERGGTAFWTVMRPDGEEADYPEEMRTDPLNLEWWDLRLERFAEACIREDVPR